MCPTAIDGVALAPVELIANLNARAGATGFGRLDMVENRRVALRVARSTNAQAHLPLLRRIANSKIWCWNETWRTKRPVSRIRWAELIYDGMWFSPLKEALDAFVADTQRHVTGDVRLRFEAPVYYAWWADAVQRRCTTTV